MSGFPGLELLSAPRAAIEPVSQSMRDLGAPESCCLAAPDADSSERPECCGLIFSLLVDAVDLVDDISQLVELVGSIGHVRAPPLL